MSSCRGAGTGGLGLAIEGPSEAKMSCKDNKDGSCTVEYIPFTPGDYDVNITFGGRPIPGVHGGAGAGEAAGGLPSETETGRKSDVRLVPRAGWPRAPPAGREQSWQARVLWSWSRGRVVGTVYSQRPSVGILAL